jgi:hypothetical protein
MIATSEITPDMRTLTGLKDVNNTVSSITTTSFTATLTYDYGTAVTKQPVKGLLIGDFDLNELTPTPGSITITSVRLN